MSSMRLIGLCVAVTLCIGATGASAAPSNVGWKITGPSNYLTDEGGTKITGDIAADGYLNAGYVMLVELSGVTWNGLEIGGDGDGVQGGDSVAAKTWVGEGFGGSALAQGHFDDAFTVADPGLTGSEKFVIVFFTDPAANYASGLIPTSGYYGYDDNGGSYWSGAGTDVAFQMSGVHQATLPIPEPGTLALALVGLGSVLALRKKRG